MFSLDPLGLLSGSEKEEDPNDIGLIPIEYRSVYRDPYIVMALESTATVGQVATNVHILFFAIVNDNSIGSRYL